MFLMRVQMPEDLSYLPLLLQAIERVESTVERLEYKPGLLWNVSSEGAGVGCDITALNSPHCHTWFLNLRSKKCSKHGSMESNAANTFPRKAKIDPLHAKFLCFISVSLFQDSVSRQSSGTSNSLSVSGIYYCLSWDLLSLISLIPFQNLKLLPKSIATAFFLIGQMSVSRRGSVSLRCYVSNISDAQSVLLPPNQNKQKNAS